MSLGTRLGSSAKCTVPSAVRHPPSTSSSATSTCSSPTCLKKGSPTLRYTVLSCHSLKYCYESFGLSCFQRRRSIDLAPGIKQTTDRESLLLAASAAAAAPQPVLLCRLNPQKYYDDFQFRKARTTLVGSVVSVAVAIILRLSGRAKSANSRPALPLSGCKKKNSCLTLPFPLFPPST